MSQLPIGTRAPDFELCDRNGRAHRLSAALSRGPVVLAFYKAECPTCQFTFPYIQRIVSGEGKNASWTVWGISQDDAAETRRFSQQFGLTFDLLVDDYPYHVSSTYGLEFVPGIFIVQPGGLISMSEFGFSKSSLNQLAGFEYFRPGDGLPAVRPG